MNLFTELLKSILDPHVAQESRFFHGRGSWRHAIGTVCILLGLICLARSFDVFSPDVQAADCNRTVKNQAACWPAHEVFPVEGAVGVWCILEANEVCSADPLGLCTHPRWSTAVGGRCVNAVLATGQHRCIDEHGATLVEVHRFVPVCEYDRAARRCRCTYQLDPAAPIQYLRMCQCQDEAP